MKNKSTNQNESDLDKLARLRGLSRQDILAVDRNVRACGLYHSEQEIERVTKQTIEDNFDSIWRYRYGNGRGKANGKG